MWQVTRDSWKLLGMSIASAFLSGFCVVDTTRLDDLREEIMGGVAGVLALMAYMSIMLMMRTLIFNEGSGNQGG
jgi:hypothetical protein